MISVLHDLSLRRTTLAATDLPATVERSRAERLVLRLADNLTSASLGATASLLFTLKEKGHRNADPLLQVTLTDADLRENSTDTYEATYDAITAAVNTLLGVSGGADNIITSKLCEGQISYRAADGDDWQDGALFDVLLVNTVRNEEDDTPAHADTPEDWLNDRAIRYLPLVVGLTGGGATKLDGLATVDLDAGAAVCLFDDGSSSTHRVYELVAGTDAESSPNVIRPDDYNASTNAKVWKLRNASSGGGGAWGGITGTLSDQTDLQAALDAKAPSARTMSAAGLASGGGDLSADRTITVAAASQAQAEAGTNNVTAMTPLRTAQAIAALAPGGGGAVSLDNCIFVAKNGNDSNSGSLSAPLLTLGAAKTAATSGKTVVVFPGAYTITGSLLKDGVNWHFFNGATVTRTNAADHAGIFDDGGAAITSLITGDGAFSFVCNYSGSGRDYTGAVYVSHASSNVRIFCSSITISGTSTVLGLAPVAVIDGTCVVIADLLDGSVATSGGASAVIWVNGPCYVKAVRMLGKRYGIWGQVVATPTGDCFIDVQSIKLGSSGDIIFYFNNTQATAAMWINFHTAETQGTSSSFANAVHQSNGKLYLTGQKMWGSVYLATGGGLLYVDVDKLQAIKATSGGEANLLKVRSGVARVSVRHYEPLSFAGKQIVVSGGIAHLNGGDLVLDNAGDAGSHTITVTGQPAGGTGSFIDVPYHGGSKRIWFNIDSAGMAPSGGDIEVAIASGDNAATIAAAIVTAVGSSYWTAAAVSGVVTLTDLYPVEDLGTPADGSGDTDVVKSVSIDSPGSGISDGTYDLLFDGVSGPATGTATASGGVITSVSLTGGGNGYSSPPVITLDGADGSPPTLTAHMFNRSTGYGRSTTPATPGAAAVVVNASDGGGVAELRGMCIDATVSNHDGVEVPAAATATLKECEVLAPDWLNDLKRTAGTLNVRGGNGSGTGGNFRASGTITFLAPN